MYLKIRELFPAIYAESKQIGKLDKNIVLKVVTEEEKKAIKEAKKQEEPARKNKKNRLDRYRATFARTTSAGARFTVEFPIFSPSAGAARRTAEKFFAGALVGFSRA